MQITVQSLAEWEESGIKDMLSIVIPAHNEAGHIEETISLLANTLNRENIFYEILSVKKLDQHYDLLF